MTARARLLISATLAVVVAVAGGCAGPGPATPGPEVGPLTWTTCADVSTLQCATLSVPLDHDQPAGQQVTLPLVKIPAADPDRKLGAVVLHRGGPGYSGVEYVRRAHTGQLPLPLNAPAAARYDVIGFDQRGVGGSSPAVRCFASDAAGQAFAAGLPAFPVTDEERRMRAAKDADYAQRCRAASGALLDHLTSADAARDLDLMRTALGAQRLNLVGQSYGSYLAAVYANLFPGRVGRFVLDSILDPVRETTGEAGTVPGERTGADAASEAALAELFRLCAEAGTRCAFGDGNPAAAFDTLLDRLRAVPVQLTAPDGRELLLTDRFILAVAGGLLYQPGLGTWEMLTGLLAQTAQVSADPGSQLAAQYAADGLALVDTGLGDAGYTGISPAYHAVHCTDADTPDDAAGWAQAAQRRQGIAPHFAALRAYEDSACAFWTGADSSRYTGPWSSPTDQPALIVNSRFDPATPLDSAIRLHETLPNSRLLINEGWGHITTQQSSCAVEAISTYLVDGRLPADGAVCHPDRTPFAPQ